MPPEVSELPIEFDRYSDKKSNIEDRLKSAVVKVTLKFKMVYCCLLVLEYFWWGGKF